MKKRTQTPRPRSVRGSAPAAGDRPLIVSSGALPAIPALNAYVRAIDREPATPDRGPLVDVRPFLDPETAMGSCRAHRESGWDAIVAPAVARADGIDVALWFLIVRGKI